MIRRSDITVSDSIGTPEPGVYVTVKKANGTLATLYDDAGALMGNPLTSGIGGAFYYNIADADAGSFTEEYRLSLSDSPRTVIAISLVAAPADTITRVDTIVALKASGTIGPLARLARYVSEVGKGGMFVAKAAAAFTTLIAADSNSAVYAQSTTDSSVVWVREDALKGQLHSDWLGSLGDDASPNDTAFGLWMQLARASVASGAAAGLAQGVEMRMGFGTYRLVNDFSCKGFTANWKGLGPGTGSSNTGASKIRMASGKTFYIDRSNTEGATGYSASPTIIYGADNSCFYDICFMGPGKGVGAAPVVQLRANAVHFYNCWIMQGGGHGLYVYATSGAHDISEGNANCWRWFGGGIINCGGSLIKTLGADANAGEMVGVSLMGATNYGCEEESFLGNKYSGHWDGNLLGHLHGTGANNSSEFIGYFESGYPYCTIPGNSRVRNIAGVTPVLPSGGAAMFGRNVFNQFRLYAAESGDTLDIEFGSGTTTNARKISHSTYAPNGFFETFGKAGFAPQDFWIHYNGAEIYALTGPTTTQQFGRGAAQPYYLAAYKFALGGFSAGRVLSYSSAAPAAGPYAQGEFAFNLSPTKGGIFGWSCYSSGSPGGQVADYTNARAEPDVGIGYVTGAGGAVTQLTSKTTAATLNKVCGQFTTNNAALAAGATATFQVNNSNIAATDVIDLNLQSGHATKGTYDYWIDGVGAGLFFVTVLNRSAGSLSEALTFNFAAVKAVAA